MGHQLQLPEFQTPSRNGRRNHFKKKVPVLELLIPRLLLVELKIIEKRLYELRRNAITNLLDTEGILKELKTQ